jgi:hypothetical protein
MILRLVIGLTELAVAVGVLSDVLVSNHKEDSASPGTATLPPHQGYAQVEDRLGTVEDDLASLRARTRSLERRMWDLENPRKPTSPYR